MEGKKKLLANTCRSSDVRPIMADLPYPPLEVQERNPAYAALLSVDYCGAVSEMSAITQYINNENRLSFERCQAAKTLLGIGMAEMMHLKKLGALIVLLGGNIGFTANYGNGRQKMWTPEYLTLSQNMGKMLLADIESERDAIQQYKKHISMIRDRCVNAVLARIIKDEEYHIMLLECLLQELKQ